MIPASVLLILVAVTLLVLGLAGGSSTLLIGSIVASLLAAVALVIGARHAASQRRAAGTPDGLTVDMDDVSPPPASARAAPSAARSRRAGSDFSPSDDQDADFAGSNYAASSVSDYAATAGPGSDADPADTAVFADQQGMGVHPGAGGSDLYDDDPRVGAPIDDPRAGAPIDDPRAARGDGDSHAAGTARGEGDLYGGRGASDLGPGDDADDLAGFTAGDGSDRGARAAGDRPAPDYDRASSVIGAARSDRAADEAWRRDPDAEAPPLAADVSSPEGSSYSAGLGDMPLAEDAGDEFGEPDEDDPADEPLPQAVRPGDAVRIARLDDEVLVVDGRPRYHLSDCPHLIGKRTEPLPANEAVELGFSPCGLCRPVDRLVARAAHR
jgi:clumping factor A